MATDQEILDVGSQELVWHHHFYLMVTNFCKDLRGSEFFCVEMTWNDPLLTFECFYCHYLTECFSKSFCYSAFVDQAIFTCKTK